MDHDLTNSSAYFPSVWQFNEETKEWSPSLTPQGLVIPPAGPSYGTTQGGVKYDQGKRRWDLLPWRATEEIVKVMEFGAKKYGDHNWQKGMKWSRLFSATCRHLFAWWRGEDKDPETGLSHIAHAACCILFILDYVEGSYGEDDRAK